MLGGRLAGLEAVHDEAILVIHHDACFGKKMPLFAMNEDSFAVNISTQTLQDGSRDGRGLRAPKGQGQG